MAQQPIRFNDGGAYDDLAAYLSNTPEAAPGGAALSYAQ